VNSMKCFGQRGGSGGEPPNGGLQLTDSGASDRASQLNQCWADHRRD
jgi:hypothetical protein